MKHNVASKIYENDIVNLEDELGISTWSPVFGGAEGCSGVHL